MSNICTAVVLASIFIIMLTFTIHALGQSQELRKIQIILALPVSSLCLFGLLRSAGNTQQITMVDFVLVPYGTLTYTVIFIIIIWLFSKYYLRIRNASENRHCQDETRYEKDRRKALSKKEKRANAKLHEQ